MAAFKEKLLIWKIRVNDNNSDMFPLTAKTKFTDCYLSHSPAQRLPESRSHLL
jgi:hypothetical protein